MKRWPLRLSRPKLLIAAAALFGLYLWLGGYLLPRYLERAIPEYAASELKRKASVGSVTLNPLLFRATLDGFALAESDGREIARFRRLVVDFELSSLARWAWTFSTLALDGLELRADIAPDGSFNLAELAASFPKGEGGADADAPPPRLLLQHVAITDAAIVFSDRSGPRPRFDSVRPLALELHDLSTLPDRKAPYSVNARLPGGATLGWRGEVSLRPIVSAGEIVLRRGKPASLWKFFQEDLAIAEPAGEVDISLRYRAAYARGAPEALVEDIRIAVRDVALAQPGAPAPFFALQSAAVSGGRFDLAARELRVPSIELRDALLRAEIGADGAFDLVKLAPAEAAPSAPKLEAGVRPWRVRLDAVKLGGIALELRDLSGAAPLALRAEGLEASLEGGALDLGERRVGAQRIALAGGSIAVARGAGGHLPALEPARTKLDKPDAPAVAAGKPWRLALDALEVGGLKISYADRGFSPPLAYDIDPLSVTVRDFRNEGKAPVRLEAALRVAQGGSLRVSAEASPALDRASARATLERLSLKPLQPVVASRTALALRSGEVSATMQAQFRVLKDRAGARQRAELRTRGAASVNDLLLVEAATGERFLEWKSVTANGIAFSLAPGRLAIDNIVASGLGAKVLVNKDRSVNLAQALRPPGDPAPAPAATYEPAGEPFPVSVERVRLDRATVDFSDQSLVLPFSAKIQEFSGDVLGLSTDRASRAVAKLEGRVDEFGLARVDGSLSTYDPKAFLDLRVAFSNVEMSPLSAYSVTFAGRRIASGRLGLDLRYRIDDGALAGDNKVELRNFTLGEPVEAPGALSLPLDLAVALLTDAEGRIVVAVPVKGNVNEPEFSYGHLVWQAITTLLTNIVTAPFRALFGGGEELEHIAFDPGHAALTPPEREKLKRLAGALGERPKLKVVVEGQYGEPDRGALRAREVAAAVSAKLERAEAGAEPEPVNPREARTQRALEALFVERNSEEALAAFIAGIEKARGKPVERIGRLAALAGRPSADGVFYDALLARLVETAPLPGDALEQLARARAEAVEGHLVQALTVPPARVARKESAAGEGSRVKLALDAAGGS